MIKRITELRKREKLSQEQFAERLGLSRNFINQVETGKKNVSDRTIADICRIFNVDETWLRTGEGKMFKDVSATEELEQMLTAISVSEDETIKRIIRAYWRLSDNKKSAVRELIDNMVEESKQTAEPDAGKDIPVPATAQDLAAKVAELERQNQELAAKVAAMEEEDIARGLWDGSPTLPPASAG